MTWCGKHICPCGNYILLQCATLAHPNKTHIIMPVCCRFWVINMPKGLILLYSGKSVLVAINMVYAWSACDILSMPLVNTHAFKDHQITLYLCRADVAR